jgi:hypothetical protein
MISVFVRSVDIGLYFALPFFNEAGRCIDSIDITHDAAHEFCEMRKIDMPQLFWQRMIARFGIPISKSARVRVDGGQLLDVVIHSLQVFFCGLAPSHGLKDLAKRGFQIPPKQVQPVLPEVVLLVLRQLTVEEPWKTPDEALERQFKMMPVEMNNWINQHVSIKVLVAHVLHQKFGGLQISSDIGVGCALAVTFQANGVRPIGQVATKEAVALTRWRWCVELDYAQ